MSAGEVALQHGPLDGGIVRPSRFQAYCWIDPLTMRCYRERKPGRLLYRRTGHTTMEYAGLTHSVCPGCGCLHQRVKIRTPGAETVDLTETCSLCGRSFE